MIETRTILSKYDRVTQDKFQGTNIYELANNPEMIRENYLQSFGHQLNANVDALNDLVNKLDGIFLKDDWRKYRDRWTTTEHSQVDQIKDKMAETLRMKDKVERDYEELYKYINAREVLDKYRQIKEDLKEADNMTIEENKTEYEMEDKVPNNNSLHQKKRKKAPQNRTSNDLNINSKNNRKRNLAYSKNPSDSGVGHNNHHQNNQRQKPHPARRQHQQTQTPSFTDINGNLPTEYEHITHQHMYARKQNARCPPFLHGEPMEYGYYTIRDLPSNPKDIRLKADYEYQTIMPNLSATDPSWRMGYPSPFDSKRPRGNKAKFLWHSADGSLKSMIREADGRDCKIFFVGSYAAQDIKGAKDRGMTIFGTETLFCPMANNKQSAIDWHNN